MKVQSSQSPVWGWLWLAVAIVVGVGLGILLRPTINGLLRPNSNQPQGQISGVCKDPTSASLVLTEGLTSTVSDSKVLYARSYTLQRPGQPTFAFDAGGDSNSEPLNCQNVRFGPGPRLVFGRGPEAITLEYVGPLFHHYSLLTDKAIAGFAVQPRWKLGLNLSAYAAGAPQLDEVGQGALSFTRTTLAPGLPQRLVFHTQDAGNTYALDEGQTLASVVQ